MNQIATLTIIAHKFLRIILLIAVVPFWIMASIYVGADAIAIVSSLLPEEFAEHLATLGTVSRISQFLLYGVMGIICIAVALHHRNPLYQLSHDAMMSDMERIMGRVIISCHQGLFDSVPKFRRAEEIAKWVQSGVTQMSMQHGEIAGKISEAYINMTSGTGSSELNRLLSDVQSLSIRADTAKEKYTGLQVLLDDIEKLLATVEGKDIRNNKSVQKLEQRISEVSEQIEQLKSSVPIKTNIKGV